jgi:hypothetical protein
MAGYSARQASYTTGDTITAAHSNDEFNQVLAAFHATTGHSHDGTAGEGGPISTLRDADSLNKILVDTSNNHLEFYVEVSSAAVQQLRIQDGAIVPITDNDIDLGTSSLEFKDLFIDGTANVDAINLDGTLITSTAAELNILDGVTSTAAELNLVDGITAGTVSASLAVIADSNKDISGFRNVTLTSTLEIDAASGDPTIILDTQGADKFHVAVDDSDSDNLVIKSGGTVGSGSGLKLDSSGNLTVDGDLTVTGDDITMGTNTAGNLLIADGTNFNSIAVGSLSEISSVASDDVLLAVDTSGGGLKKITRSNLVSGLATSSALTNVVEDTSPQLGGDLDMNGQDIVTTSNANIDLLPNGTGKVIMDGNGSSGGVSVSDGLIDIRTGTGNVAKVKFYCESSNAHAQTLQAAPHSASSSAVLVLPTASGTLIGTGDTGTLPLAAMDIDGGTDIGADLTTSDLIVVDDGAGGTNRKAALSRLTTFMTGQGFVTDDPTALAIALG